LKKKDNDYQNPNQTSGKKQAIGTVIGVVIGLVIFYILFDVIGIGGSVIPKRNYGAIYSNQSLYSFADFAEFDGDMIDGENKKLLFLCG